MRCLTCRIIYFGVDEKEPADFKNPVDQGHQNDQDKRELYVACPFLTRPLNFIWPSQFLVLV